MHYSDEAQTKIIMLREKAEKEQQAYIQEIKELDRILEQDRRLKEFMATKTSKRNEKGDGQSNYLKKGTSGGFVCWTGKLTPFLFATTLT